MSHAQTKQQRGASSSLESADLLIWMYTANAVAASKKRSVCEPVGKANCVPTESTTGRKTVIYRLRAELLQIEEILYKIGRNLHGRRGDVRITEQLDRKGCTRGSKVGADGE